MKVNSSLGAAIATVQSYLPSIADTAKFGTQVASGLESALSRDTRSVLTTTINSLIFFQIAKTSARRAYNAPTLNARVGYSIAAMGSAAVSAYFLYSLITSLQQDGARIPKCETILTRGQELLEKSQVTDQTDQRQYSAIIRASNAAERDFINNWCWRVTDKEFPTIPFKK